MTDFRFQPSGRLDLENLSEYARKVKHIQFRSSPEDLAVLGSLLDIDSSEVPLFTKVTSVEITADGCATSAVNFSLTQALKSVDIDTGINTGRKPAGVDRSRHIANYLLAASVTCQALEHVRVRGFACEQLNKSISHLSKLRVLSLKVGNSLSTDTLVAISFFPVLEELVVHADRVDPEEFKEKLALRQAPVFPSLQTLQIRSQFSVVETIFENIRSTTFSNLDVEAIDSQDTSAWTQLFTTMRSHAAIPHTLERLRLDHHIELDGDIEDTPPLSHQNDDRSLDNTCFTLNTFSPLSKLPNLKSFTVAANFPPDLDDKDVDQILRWWPLLESLDLGIWPEDEDEEEGDVTKEKWIPRTTISSLESAARRCPKLQSLVLPVNVGLENTPSPLISQGQLSKLVFSAPGTTLSATTDAYIRGLFPSLDGALLV